MKARIISYLRFQCQAKHLHGIHSPFVYNLLESAFNNVTENNPKTVHFPALQSAERQNRKDKKRVHFLSNIVTETSTLRHKIVSAEQVGKIPKNEGSSLINDCDVLFLTDLRCNEKVFALWEELYSLPQVTLAIDCWHDGILFLNRPMEKQYFKIRI